MFATGTESSLRARRSGLGFQRADLGLVLLAFLVAVPALAGRTEAPSRTPEGDAALGVEAPQDVVKELAEGIQALRERSPVRAEGAFRGVLEVASTNVGAMLGLAQSLEAQGRIAEALTWVGRATELEPTPAVLGFAAGLAARVDRPDEALGFFELQRQELPDHPAGYVGAALLLRDLGRSSEAVKLLEEARGRSIGGGLVERELSLLYLESGDPGEAKALGLEAWRLGGESGDVAAAIGLASAELLDPSGSAVRADPEAGLDPELAPGSGAIHWLREALRLGTSQAGLVHRSLASVFAKLERNEEALAEFDAALALDPENPEAHYQRALLLQVLGRSEAAEAALGRFQELTEAEEAAEDAGRALGLALNRAQELANQNDLAGALGLLQELADEHPTFAPIRALRSKILFSMGENEAAFEESRRAREYDPSRTEYHYLEALFAAEMGAWASAESAIENTLALDPELAEALRLRDEIRKRRGSAESLLSGSREAQE